MVRRVLPVGILLGALVGGCGGDTSATKEAAAKPLYGEPTGVGMPKDYKKLMSPTGKPAQK